MRGDVGAAQVGRDVSQARLRRLPLWCPRARLGRVAARHFPCRQFGLLPELERPVVVSALAKRHARLTQRPHRRARAIKGSVYRRRRRLRDGELQRLDKASKDCRGLNRYYVPLAIYLAIETGTRLQEIFNLTWRDMDPKSRRIEIHNSKTDHLSGSEGRTIVLTPLAGLFLMRLEVQLSRAKRFKLNNRIFPLSKEAMKQI